MDRLTGEWTGEGVKGGLIRFYREIANVGLVFPRADHPIAVEFPGYPDGNGRPPLYPPLKRRDPPLVPPSLVARKRTPPSTPL